MDTLYASLLSLFVLVLSFSLHFFIYYESKTTKNSKLLPPGRTGWPIIGESLEFLSTGWKGHPEKFVLDRMSKFSPLVFRTSLMLENAAVFCGAQGNKFLFSNENKLVQVWWPSSAEKIFPSSSSTDETSKTKQAMIMRRMVNTTLSPETLRSYVPIMDAMIQKHFAIGWDGKDEIITYELTKNFTFTVACKIFVSIDDPEKVRYLCGPFESIILGFFSIPIDLPGTPYRRGIVAANFIRKELIAIVKQRKIDLAQGKATPTQDILSHMLLFRDEDGNGMEEYDIANKILVSLIAGHDTTSSTSAFIVKFLAEFPQVYNRVYEEHMEIAKSKADGELLKWEDLSKMKYSWNVACEVLRLVPPIQGAFREAMVDFMYNGYFIPKGWKLYWSAYSTQKNPEFFPRPEKFDPTRFEGNESRAYTFIPFGGGLHVCPGRTYARLEILVFMHHLVRKFKWEKVIPDEQIIYKPTPVPAKGLPIRLYPHKIEDGVVSRE
ncbi:hypothetical protein L6452_09791 [Arctium lappa]|uniref:Uncharacterized protein n=1 Tax=Arctium lappa TaxID=4217 RepID=A0ACB9DLA2_ARCLA|nr:hypothetical protein L6452_09791 [Arctium lappa]